jgi:hypothetical protein
VRGLGGVLIPTTGEKAWHSAYSVPLVLWNMKIGGRGTLACG